jgi:hypothetical protein
MGDGWRCAVLYNTGAEKENAHDVIVVSGLLQVGGDSYIGARASP